MRFGNVLINWNPALKTSDILVTRLDEYFGYTVEALFPRKSIRDNVL